jgi:metal-responsive CopG/Arc/MetJ family transcriptional regulator
MTRISISIPPDQLAKLKRISEETGAPISELIRRAIAKMLTSK